MKRAAVTALAATLALGCDAGQASDRTSGPGGGLQAPVSARPTAGPPASFGPPPSPTPPDDATPIALDTTLLAYLPPDVEGAPLLEDLDVAAEALLDPALSRIATGVDAAVAVDAGTTNLVTAWVVRLREGQFGDEAYRQWRDSYDEGACSAAGGVTGSAEADIAGRTTFITTCVSAIRTYHVWLPEEDVLVSASSIGEGRFGERLMATLRLAR